MKDALLALARRHEAPSVRLNVVRECLQAAMLKSLERHGAMASLAFHGGTALRCVYGIATRRTWISPGPQGQPTAWRSSVNGDLWNHGIAARAGIAERERMVETRFEVRALAQELGLPALGARSRSPSARRVRPAWSRPSSRASRHSR